MLTLYYAPSTASLVVHWLLIELGLPHELRKLDLKAGEQKSAEYLQLNPAGVVPTLVIDGQALCEAAAITMHLGDTYSAAGLAPAPGTPARANYYQWMFFLANTLQPAYRAYFYPSEPAGESNLEASREHARLRIEASLARVAAHLEATGPFLLGDKLSAADFLMTMLLRWSRNMQRPSDDWPVLQQYARSMKARPSFREVYAREGLTDWT
jgi:glutathione S-transferase